MRIKFRRSKSDRFGRNYGIHPETFDSLCPAFQGHWRLLEPLRIDRLPMTPY